MNINFIISDVKGPDTFDLDLLGGKDDDLRYSTLSAADLRKATGSFEPDIHILCVEDREEANALARLIRERKGIVGVSLDRSDALPDPAWIDFAVTTAPEPPAVAAELGIPVFHMPNRAEAARAKTVPAAAAVVAPADGRRMFYPERPAPDGEVNDWVFVASNAAKGWILDAICREIGTRSNGTWQVVYNPKQLPRARNYFFSHYSLYMIRHDRNPDIHDAKTFVWYTHPRDIPYTLEQQLDGYSSATQMIFTCAAFREDWLQKGLPPSRGRVVLGGADETLFRAHERGAGAVGLSSSFYERKNPDVLLDLVRMMPHRRFLLVGRNWEEYSRFKELTALANFRYQTASYEEYPAIYAKFDVFLSMSVLEGGPIPLLEAMMCNAVPVASRTGFAPDLIRHGENGFLFDVGADASTIAPLIDSAFDLGDTDIRATVLDCSWDRFAEQILALGR